MPVPLAGRYASYREKLVSRIRRAIIRPPERRRNESGHDDLGDGGVLTGPHRSRSDGGGLRGHDVIYGYRGADELYGNQGSDRLYGGKGADKLYGGDGDDKIYSGGLDGKRDLVSCGWGRDFASIAENDRAARNCEVVVVTIE